VTKTRHSHTDGFCHDTCVGHKKESLDVCVCDNNEFETDIVGCI